MTARDLVFLGSLVLAQVAWSQLPGMTESMRAAQQVTSQLDLDEAMAQALLEAALPWDACLGHWENVQDSLESAPITEDALLDALAPVRSALGACRTNRSLAMRAVLDSVDQMKYDALALPARPNVMHFGIHNRMDCNICKTPQNQP